MTIGILASGPNAGLAVFRALAAAEKVASGAIGGFAAFAAIGTDGKLYRAETQRGGTTTLFTDAESTGTEPPAQIASATMAALMSSGPDRPAPLSQFVAAQAGAGLVTGHRLPNAAGLKGVPVNVQVLEKLQAGLSARRAVRDVMTANPDADAGIIAVDRQGSVYALDSARVAARTDLGHARLEDESGAIVEVLHNAITPVGSLAALVCEIAMREMVPPPPLAGSFLVCAGTALRAGAANRVLTSQGIAKAIETTDHVILSGRHNCAAVYLGAEVVDEAGVLGYTITEPNVVVENARIVSLSGQDKVAIGYRRTGAADRNSAALRRSASDRAKS